MYKHVSSRPNAIHVTYKWVSESFKYPDAQSPGPTVPAKIEEDHSVGKWYFELSQT